MANAKLLAAGIIFWLSLGIGLFFLLAVIAIAVTPEYGIEVALTGFLVLVVPPFIIAFVTRHLTRDARAIQSDERRARSEYYATTRAHQAASANTQTGSGKLLFCSFCGFQHSPDSDWCPKCGRREPRIKIVAPTRQQPRPAEAHKPVEIHKEVIREVVRVKCSYCGSLNDQIARNCACCGARL